MPSFMGNLPVYVQVHDTIFYVSEMALPVSYVGGYEIQSVEGIIESVQTVGFSPFHRIGSEGKPIYKFMNSSQIVTSNKKTAAATTK